MSVNISRRRWLQASAATIAGLGLVRCSYELEQMETAEVPVLPPSDVVRISSNENPYGISGKTQQAIVEAVQLSNRYPGGHRNELTELIAEHENVENENIFIGAGSTEILYLTALLYSTYGGEVVMADPSYFLFRGYFSRVGGNLRLVPLNDQYVHDLEVMDKRINDSTRITFICNPNNPTGTIVPGDELKSWCRRISNRTTVFVDEAYHELVDDPGHSSMVDLVREGRDVIVARTFSKIFGLAGLRVGYGIAHPDIISNMRRIQTNFSSVSVLSLRAAIASYKDKEFLAFTKQKNMEVRSYLYSVLDKHEYFYIPSHTNFVLFRIDRDAREFAEELEERKVFIRTFAFNDAQWIRASIGTMGEMRIFAENLEELS